ncbi:DUF1361 domain-containing protein [Cohnella sp. CFH 77786]|uniref:DUF1361 domain-containing protein n=1 Tax=Cohnella sp. CFH 77786 TaxID=2662265 RepID=UPI001C608E75|nr:DUF1361 domain-containing protein [Cohnella sp. CFH 77786]
MPASRGRSQDRLISDPVSFPVYGIIGGISVLCVLLIIVRIIRMGDNPFGFMLWNLFLAWLPLIFSMTAIQIQLKKRGAVKAILLPILGAGWLVLYPNAPYLTTDFIHVIFQPYHPDSLILWYDLVVFFLFSWCGLLLAYGSMRHFQAIVRHYADVRIGWLFIAAVSFLGGFGVYLGRVERLNSWDVLFSPFRLIEGVLEGLNPGAFIFTFLIGMLILILYVSLYALHRERERID